MWLLDDVIGGWQRYRRWRGGYWQYNPYWGWMHDEHSDCPELDIEDYRK